MVEMTTEESKKRMQEGRLYLPEDEEIMRQQLQCLEKLYDYEYVIIPDTKYVTPEILSAVKAYAENGGKLIITKAAVEGTEKAIFEEREF